jgi:16S rRNA (guanine(527)-N(7))-methyltransferase RsmG
MFKELLAREFAPYGTLSDIQLERLESHYTALTRWNERLNLTRIRGLEESVRFHYCESLFLGRFLPPGPHRIVDIGSGGGFPGVPVAIIRPECEVTLVESHQRKAVFLREISRGLGNVCVIPKRAEEVEATFDWLVSRAVAPDQVLELKLSRDVALLIGEEDSASLTGVAVPIPWGNHRVLFHVERHGT